MLRLVAPFVDSFPDSSQNNEIILIIQKANAVDSKITLGVLAASIAAKSGCR